MGLMRDQFTFTLLCNLFAIGCITHNVKGVCDRPVFSNPYAITVEPDKDVYADSAHVELGCEGGHTPYGLPENVYCSLRNGWEPDPSTGLCFAQCNITQLIEDDDIKAIDDNNEQQTIFNHREIAYFECTDKGQFAGSDRGTCDNGTLILSADDPTCLAYCQVLVDKDGMVGDGLYYETVDTPVINETSTIYYRDDDKITYKCLDGYVGPHDCSTPDCRSTCEDGSWIPDPPDIPVCADAPTTTSDASTAASDAIVITSDTTTLSHIATTATSLIPTAEDTTVSPTTVSETTTFTICYRPVFSNPYAITVEPDKDVYADYERVELGCEEGHTPYGLPENIYCSLGNGWDQDPSTGLCFAQCNITQLIEDDDIKAIDHSNEQQTIFNHGEIAYFECSEKGQVAGSDRGTCDNGTLILNADDPTCLAYCPVLVDKDGMIGDGLYYDTVETPVINDTSTIYYRDDVEITYKCLDGYVGPLNCSTHNCKSTCEDGSWIPDPPDIPVCDDVPTTTSDASTAASDAIVLTSDTTTLSHIATTTTSDASTAASDAIVITSDTTTFSQIATTATSRIPTAKDTTVSPTTETTSFTTASPETTETDPDPTTTPEAKESTSLPTTKHTTPLGTGEPGSTPLPCGGECEASEVCNRDNICECRPDFYPDEDDICRVPLSFDVNITITEINGAEANYTEDLNNDTTKEFKQLEEGVCQPINEVYGNDTEYIGCQVLEFSEGSIKINYILKFAENSTQNSTTVDQTIQDELSKSDSAFTGNFTFDSSSLTVEPMNECMRQIDDCSENATCIDHGKSGYTCSCNEGYSDAGVPKYLQGRICIELYVDVTLQVELIVSVTIVITVLLTIIIVLICWKCRICPDMYRESCGQIQAMACCSSIRNSRCCLRTQENFTSVSSNDEHELSTVS